MGSTVAEEGTMTENQEKTSDREVSDATCEQVWERFVAFLKKGGNNVTETRHIILKAVLSRSDHFRADQLVAQLTSGPERVSRGSVYRTLALLTEAGIVRTLRNGEAHVHYEHTIDRGSHEHMICDGCGRFIEFEPEEIAALIDRVCDKKRFMPREYRLVIYGHCQRCRAKGEKDAR